MIRVQPTAKKNQVKVTFVLAADQPHLHPCVVGDFNRWDPAANPFKKRRNGDYSTSAILKAGQTYCFRYLCQSGEWFNEEEAHAYQPSEFGSHNCVLST